MCNVIMRDNEWLENRVRDLWQTYYSDARTGYPITVKFGPRARYRYGSIYSSGEQCHILVNRLFAHPDVPQYVVDATLVHELAHYIHGYGSGLRKLHAHPHRGGVVDREMMKRGCYDLEERATEWRADNWQAFYESQSRDTIAKRANREQRDRTVWDAYLSTANCRSEEQLRERAQTLASSFGMPGVPFVTGWLYASVRRNGLSYRFRREGSARLHALLADPKVPIEVVDYELSYWLALAKVGGRWSDIENAMKDAGVWESAQKAIRWRRNSWPKFLAKNHPLKAK